MTSTSTSWQELASNAATCTQGHPFAGPVGRILDRILDRALDRALDNTGISRADVYLTNAVEDLMVARHTARLEA